MKILVVAVALVAVAVPNFANEVNLLSKIKSPQLRAYLEQNEAYQRISTRLEGVCPGSSSKALTALISAVECGENDGDLTICASVKKHLDTCMAPFVKVLEDCLPPAAKYIPSLVIKSIVSTTAYTCGLDGEHIMEFMADCVYNQDMPALLERKADLKQCTKTLKDKYEDMKEKTPSATEICSFGNSFRTCWQTYIRSACSNEVTRSAWNGLYDSIVAPCSTINEIKN